MLYKEETYPNGVTLWWDAEDRCYRVSRVTRGTHSLLGACDRFFGPTFADSDEAEARRYAESQEA